jgi:hypothetical protein
VKGNKMPLAPDTQIAFPGTVNGKIVVAVVGWVNDFAAYAAPQEWTVDHAASNGDKIGEDEARRLFPNMKGYSYRR